MDKDPYIYEAQLVSKRLEEHFPKTDPDFLYLATIRALRELGPNRDLPQVIEHVTKTLRDFGKHNNRS